MPAGRTPGSHAIKKRLELDTRSVRRTCAEKRERSFSDGDVVAPCAPRVDGIASTVLAWTVFEVPSTPWAPTGRQIGIARSGSAPRESISFTSGAPAERPAHLACRRRAVARARPHVRSGALALLLRTRRRARRHPWAPASQAGAGTRSSSLLRRSSAACPAARHQQAEAVHGGPPSQKRGRVGCMVSVLTLPRRRRAPTAAHRESS